MKIEKKHLLLVLIFTFLIIVFTIIQFGAFDLQFQNKNLISCEKEEVVVKKTDLNGIRYKENRILLDIITEHDTLTFFTDTGGGKIIFPEALDKLEIEIDTLFNQGELLEVVHFSPLLMQKGLPQTKGLNFVYRGQSKMEDASAGVLGANWFADKAWEFNYAEKKLSLVDSIDWTIACNDTFESLYFLKDSIGSKVTDFPRLPIIIEKDTLQMLFDTGATLTLNDKSKAILNTEALLIGTSFISESIFKKWQIRYPDWKVIEKGEMHTNFDLIEVPFITIGKHKVGPVLFVSRPDENFSIWMSQWMDKEIQGAIGGSAFKYFQTIVVDYNSERALFNKID